MSVAVATRKTKTDYWFITYALAACVLFFFDAAFTSLGLSLGWSEGNKLLATMMGLIGVEATLLFMVGLSWSLMVVIVWLRHRTTKPWEVRYIYFLMVVVLVHRAYIVGQWTGIINVLW